VPAASQDISMSCKPIPGHYSQNLPDITEAHPRDLPIG
jgi:hypothetical protein